MPTATMIAVGIFFALHSGPPGPPRITQVEIDGANYWCEVVDAQACPFVLHCDCGVVVPLVDSSQASSIR